MFFFQERIVFWGFEVSTDGILPQRHKLELISKFDEPKNKKQLQQFLGL